MTADWDVVMSLEYNPDPPDCDACGSDADYILFRTKSQEGAFRCLFHTDAHA